MTGKVAYANLILCPISAKMSQGSCGKQFNNVVRSCNHNLFINSTGSILTFKHGSTNFWISNYRNNQITSSISNPLLQEAERCPQLHTKGWGNPVPGGTCRIPGPDERMDSREGQPGLACCSSQVFPGQYMLLLWWHKSWTFGGFLLKIFLINANKRRGR